MIGLWNVVTQYTKYKAKNDLDNINNTPPRIKNEYKKRLKTKENVK